MISRYHYQFKLPVNSMYMRDDSRGSDGPLSRHPRQFVIMGNITSLLRSMLSTRLIRTERTEVSLVNTRGEVAAGASP